MDCSSIGLVLKPKGTLGRRSYASSLYVAELKISDIIYMISSSKVVPPEMRSLTDSCNNSSDLVDQLHSALKDSMPLMNALLKPK